MSPRTLFSLFLGFGTAGLLLRPVLGGVTLVLGLSPLQYMAGMTGPIWLLITAIGLALGDRARRA